MANSVEGGGNLAKRDGLGKAASRESVCSARREWQLFATRPLMGAGPPGIPSSVTESPMVDLEFNQPEPPPPSLDDYRIMRMIGQSGSDFAKLPLRFKFNREPLERLQMRGLIERGESGWPGVPGYRLSKLGSKALQDWLAIQRGAV
jgi:hypothetical protein